MERRIIIAKSCALAWQVATIQASESILSGRLTAADRPLTGRLRGSARPPTSRCGRLPVFNPHLLCPGCDRERLCPVPPGARRDSVTVPCVGLAHLVRDYSDSVDRDCDSETLASDSESPG